MADDVDDRGGVEDLTPEERAAYREEVRRAAAEEDRAEAAERVAEVKRKVDAAHRATGRDPKVPGKL